MVAGSTAVTGTETIATGLTTVTSASLSLDGVTNAQVVTGTPSSGNILAKCWKFTASGDNTLITATSVQTVYWVAYGTP